MLKTLTNEELSVFSRQLAMILHSGISSLEGISILCEDAPSKEGAEILNTIQQSLEETGELAASFRESGVFPDYFIKMTEIGERSGTLEDVMDSLADHYQRQDALMRSIRASLTYPLVLLGMLFAVLLVLITQVMPVFEEVFDQLGIEASGISGTVFRISAAIQNISGTSLVLLLLLVGGCIAAMRTENGRKRIVSVLIHIPAIKKIAIQIACSRFADALSLALHSGLDIGESFSLAAGLTDQNLFQEQLQTAGTMIEEGNDFADSLREAGIFTGLNARMVSIGFRTGSSETALKNIAVDCQNEVEERIQRTVGMLEPALTAILSVLTGLILVSVMLPLLGVLTNIG